MKTKILIKIVLFMGLAAFSSCTNSHFQKPTEDKNYAGTEDENGGDRNNRDSSGISIELDRLNQYPIMAYDSDELSGDSAVAIDDFIWRELMRAQEYCTMGIVANKETSWEEAEYYFEKSLAILGDLDIDVEADSLSAESVKYGRVLTEISANYRITLISLGQLPGDISADVLISRFSDINHIKIDSAELKRLEVYAQEKETYNVPIILNERVKTCILYYQTVARDAIERYIGRSTKYLPMIIKIFQEYGLPTDLAYLALVESGFNPHAYSWARAMGLWQFIAETGRLYNMNRTWWYDERKDPVKATHAAARFLKDLYNDFGSWELALAGYNGGPGRIRSTIKKQNTNDFWKLRLKRKETMDYVPFFMAATMICKHPERFGFDNINYEPEWAYDEVRIDRSLELRTIANSLGCSIEKIQELNPELLRQSTPANMKYYNLRIPNGSKETFYAAYNEMPSAKETNLVNHKVKKGETLSAIARKYGVSTYAIREANSMSKKAKISPGKILIIPAGANYQAQAASTPTNRKYESDGDFYTVRRGDNISGIARAFGVDTKDLRRINNIDTKSQIFVGQKIRIRDDGANRATVSNDNKKYSAKSGGAYTVRSGDTLWDIAKKFGTTAAAIRKLNNLSKNESIYPGQKLQISG
jgi:membrane-bound lytic murein transglycosylase D